MIALVMALVDNLPLILDAALQLVMGLADGVDSLRCRCCTKLRLNG